MLIDCGVRILGFPLVLGYHREDIGVDAAAAIVVQYGSRATFFLITYLDTADAIIGLCRQLGVGMVQLHGDVDAGEVARLREATPGLRIVKSLVVRADNADALADAAWRFAPLVDAFITDTFDPETGASGATGLTHDWRVSRRLVECSPKPVILAGGLTSQNVRDAIRTVRPAGVDVHTGVEGADGRKRRGLVSAFVAEARAGFAALR
jgi:phosphoribosylanthranilate isomerase